MLLPEHLDYYSVKCTDRRQKLPLLPPQSSLCAVSFSLPENLSHRFLFRAVSAIPPDSARDKDFLLSPASLEHTELTEKDKIYQNRRSGSCQVFCFWFSLRTLQALRETTAFYSRPLIETIASLKVRHAEARLEDRFA